MGSLNLSVILSNMDTFTPVARSKMEIVHPLVEKLENKGDNELRQKLQLLKNTQGIAQLFIYRWPPNISVSQSDILACRNKVSMLAEMLSSAKILKSILKTISLHRRTEKSAAIKPNK